MADSRLKAMEIVLKAKAAREKIAHGGYGRQAQEDLAAMTEALAAAETELRNVRGLDITNLLFEQRLHFISRLTDI